MMAANLKTKKELVDFLDIPKEVLEWLIKKFGIRNHDKRGISYLYDSSDFLKSLGEIRQYPYSEVLCDIFEIYKKYQKYKIAMPGGLKGDVGELLTMEQLIKNFPNKPIVLLGGTKSNYDITLGSKRIQVKTYFNVENKEKFGFHIEMCPDVKHNFKEKCDFVILTEIYLSHSNDFDKNKSTLYIFDKDDFDFFSTQGCWGGRKGNKTIWNIPIQLSDKQIRELRSNHKSIVESILFYNRDEIKTLFKKSKEMWDKLDNPIISKTHLTR